MNYATNWGTKTVIVKVDPTDVVSVPNDHNFEKLRCTKYTVLSEFERPLTEALYTGEEPSGCARCSEDYEDDNDYCDECGEISEDCVCDEYTEDWG